MWISILNYQLSQIEVVDISNYKVNEEAGLDDNQIAEQWLYENGYNSDEVSYLLTDDCPLCVINNLETHLNL
uniref:MSV199 domain-containing protein n=1 Tax=Geladintestivirus 3 TaxID=3233135 RepID=A0AAU8MHC9_9CAUD